MNIIINGIATTTMASNLEALLQELEQEQSWIATAVNGELITTQQRRAYFLKSNDTVEILSPMQGG